jgi:DNA repair protein RecO (recombination protein O)
MAAVKDQAIVVRRLDYSETSQVLAFFTRGGGLQRLLAKGVKRGTKKKFATGIDLLERGEVAYLPARRDGGGLGTLTEWRQREIHMGLRSDLRRLYAGQYAAEVTAAMTEEGDPHPELYEAFAGLLGDLNDADRGAAGLSLLVGYQRQLLRSAGLWPDLTRCVMCDKPAPAGRAAYFSAHQGGLVCRACEGGLVEKRLVPAAVLTALREDDPSRDRKGAAAAAGAASGAFELLNYTISHTIGREPKLTRFVIPGVVRRNAGS